MNLKMRTSKKQGDIGLSIAITYFVSKGYTVAVPLTDSQPYDLVVDNGVLSRVQVRTTSVKANADSWAVSLRQMSGTHGQKIKFYTPGEFDFLFAVTGGGDLYLVPAEEIKQKSQLNVSPSNIYGKFRLMERWDSGDSSRL